MVIDDLLGHYYCEDCAADQPGQPQPTQKVWRAIGGVIVCKEHFIALMGREPVEPRPPEPSRPLPPADAAWTKIVHGLRARMRPAGLELQGVRNVRLGGTVEIGDGCGWLLSEAALVELFILASEYRDSPEMLKVQVRLQLHRILHGKERP